MRTLLLLLLNLFLGVAHAQETSEETTSTESVAFRDLPHVVALTDATFEHETQASTGATTGSWLLLFHSSNAYDEIYGPPLDESFWFDRHVVLASLSMKEATTTWERFKVGKALPKMVYLHKGLYYTFAKPPGGYTWASIQRFLENPGEGLPIPSPRSSMDHFYDLWSDMMQAGGPLFKGILFVYGLLASIALFNHLSKKKKEKKS